MKISLELKDEDRAKLLELAGEKPEKALADLVSEAISLFLETRERTLARQKETFALQGSLSLEQAEAFRETLGKIRSSWR